MYVNRVKLSKQIAFSLFLPIRVQQTFSSLAYRVSTPDPVLPYPPYSTLWAYLACTVYTPSKNTVSAPEAVTVPPPPFGCNTVVDCVQSLECIPPLPSVPYSQVVFTLSELLVDPFPVPSPTCNMIIAHCNHTKYMRLWKNKQNSVMCGLNKTYYILFFVLLLSMDGYSGNLFDQQIFSVRDYLLRRFWIWENSLRTPRSSVGQRRSHHSYRALASPRNFSYSQRFFQNSLRTHKYPNAPQL